MANPDRPRGFKPVRHLNGGSWNNALATRALINDEAWDESGSANAIGIGTPVVLSEVTGVVESGPLAGLPSVVPMTDEDTADVYGVVVGVGKPAAGDTLNQETGPWDASDLTNKQVLCSEVEADPDAYVLYIAPARGWVFEAQTSGNTEAYAAEAFSLDGADDLSAEQVNNTTGYSTVELVAGDEVQFRAIEIPEYVDNDPTDTNVRIHGVFVDPVGAAESQ